MLRSLLSEIVRRRLWPIPLVAVIVIVAAPMVFLKSAPSGAPTADTPAPAAAKSGKLPARAERLLATSDGAVVAKRGSIGKAHDPFTPPTSKGSAATGAGTTTAATSGTGATATSGGASSGGASSDSSPAGTTTTPPIPVGTANADGAKRKSSPTPIAPITGGEPSSPTVSSASVDVRYGEKLPTRLNRSIPKLQTFVASNNIVAVFVKYSPKRSAAVFAISPSTVVTGDVQCRRLEGLCRYVDIPVGKHARLSWRAADGTVMSRRIDVVRVGDSSSSSTDIHAASRQFSTEVDNRECLYGKLLSLEAGERLADDACHS